MAIDNNIKDEAIVQMLSVLKESGATNQIKTLHNLLLIYESIQLPWEDREAIRPRLEQSIKLIQKFKEGDKSVQGELRLRKLI